MPTDVTITVTSMLPVRMVHEIQRLALEENVSRGHMIERLLKEALEARLIEVEQTRRYSGATSKRGMPKLPNPLLKKYM